MSFMVERKNICPINKYIKFCSSYIQGNLIFPAMIEKVWNGVNVERPGDRDCHEGPEDEDEVELVLREREEGDAL